MDGTLTSTTIQVRVDLEVKAKKKYSALLRSPKLEPHHQVQFNVISKITLFLGGRGTLLPRIQSPYSKPQLQGYLKYVKNIIKYFLFQ